MSFSYEDKLQYDDELDCDDVRSTYTSYSTPTNALQSNLPGTSRVIGNLIDYARRKIERAAVILARKAGFGPNATYHEILELYRTEWDADEKNRTLICKHCFTLLGYALAKTSVESTVTAAVQRIGDLFGSRYELFLRVSLLSGDKFNYRIKAVLCSLLATPFPPKALRSTYERARQILEAHVYGQELLTIMDCARVYQDGDRFKIDWESVGLLSEVHMKDWSKVVRYVTSNIREPTISSLSLWYLQLCTSQMEGTSFFNELAGQAVDAIYKALDSCVKISSGEVGSNSAELASLLLGLGLIFFNKDMRKEAGVAVEGVIIISQELANTYPHILHPTLLQSLRRIPIRLRRVGMYEEAVKVGQAVVEIHRRSIIEDPVALEHTLANSLFIVSTCLDNVGEREKALVAIRETVEIRGRLLLKHSAVSVLDLSKSMNKLAFYLEDEENHPLALVSVQESVDVLKKVTKETQPGYGAALVRLLRILSKRCTRVGQGNDAMHFVEEAAEIYEDLKQESTAHKPRKDLLEMFCDLRVYLEGADRNQETLTIIQRFVSVLRDYEPFATGPQSLAEILMEPRSGSAIEEQDDATMTAVELVRFCRDLEKSNVPGSNFTLAQALYALSKRLSRASRWDKALDAIQEAASISPDKFSAELEQVLLSAFDYYKTTRRPWSKLFMWDKALDIMREAASRNPEKYNAKLDEALHDAFDHYRAASSWDRAFDTMQEAADRDPVRLSSKLKSALRNAFGYYRSIGRWDEAINVMRAAASRNPEIFSAKLEQALCDAFEIHKAVSEWDKALDIMREVANRNPDKFSSELNRALYDAFHYYKAQSQWDNAVSAMREAESRNPEIPGAEFEQVLHDAFNYYKAKDLWNKAVEVLWEAAKRNPDEYRSELFDYFKAQDSVWSWGKALDVMREAARRNPERYQSELNRALHDAFDYYRAKGFWYDALNAMREAANRDPDKYNSRLYQALRDAFEYYKITKDSLGCCRWDEALDIMREAASRNPEAFRSELDQAVRDAFSYYKAAGRWHKAIDAMRKAASENPDVFGPVLRQAMADSPYVHE